MDPKFNEECADALIMNAQQTSSEIPADLDAAIEFLKMQPLRQEAENMSEKYFGGACHFSVGMHMRNTWGLWHNSVLAQWFKRRGIYHADDMSGIILDSFWRTINNKPVDLAGQVAYYREFWKKQGHDPDNL